jgi:hypothetical protein
MARRVDKQKSSKLLLGDGVCLSPETIYFKKMLVFHLKKRNLRLKYEVTSGEGSVDLTALPHFSRNGLASSRPEAGTRALGTCKLEEELRL